MTTADQERIPPAPSPLRAAPRGWRGGRSRASASARCSWSAGTRTGTRRSRCCGRRSAPGVNHIDTAQFYGDCNALIRAALAPYPDDLVLVEQGRGGTGR